MKPIADEIVEVVESDLPDDSHACMTTFVADENIIDVLNIFVVDSPIFLAFFHDSAYIFLPFILIILFSGKLHES